MNIYRIKLLRSLYITITLVLACLLSACSDENNNKEPKKDASLVTTLRQEAPSKSATFGNMIVVNQTNERIYISDDPTFSSKNAYRGSFSGFSLKIDLFKVANYTEDTVIKLYALKDSDLEAFENNAALPSPSPVFISQYGGTFNPFTSSGNAAIDNAEIRVCNETGSILAVALGSEINQIEGMVDRGRCNVSVPLPGNGLTTVYFLDGETFDVIDVWEDVLSEGTIKHVTIQGDQEALNESTLNIRSQIALNVQLVDQNTGLTLNNSQCSLCPYLPSSEWGEYKVEANIDYLLELRLPDSSIVPITGSPIILTPNTEQHYVLAFEEGAYVLNEYWGLHESSDYHPQFFANCSRNGWGGVGCNISYLSVLDPSHTLTYELIDLDSNRHTYPMATTDFSTVQITARIQGQVSLRAILTDESGEQLTSEWKQFEVE